MKPPRTAQTILKLIITNVGILGRIYVLGEGLGQVIPGAWYSSTNTESVVQSTVRLLVIESSPTRLRQGSWFSRYRHFMGDGRPN